MIVRREHLCLAADEKQTGYKRIFISEPWINTEMFGVQVIGRFMVRRMRALGMDAVAGDACALPFCCALKLR